MYFAPNKNAIQKTLDAQLLAGGTVANLSDVDGVDNKPGIIVIDRVDSNGIATPSKREYISYSAISGNTLTGLTRNVDNGATDQNHEVGAIVEFVMDISWANEVTNALHSVVNVSSASYTLSENIVEQSQFSGLFNGAMSTLATLSSKNIIKPLLSGSYQTLTTDTDGATITFDLSESNVHSVTLADNRTLALSNVSIGQTFIIRLIQDVTGSRTVTWFSTIKWAGGSAPTLTTTGGKTDTLGFICTSSGNYDGYVVGQNI